MNLPKISLVLFLVLTFGTIDNTTAAQNPSATSILFEIHKQGAKKVFTRLWESNEWDYVIKQIETGEKNWLRVATKLYEATDAGASEMLILATGVALYKAPYSVLEIAAPVFSIENICGYPDLGDPPLNTKVKSLAYLDARIKTVRSLNQEEVAQHREQCLETLNKTRIEVAGPKGPFSR
jgi:hypothetical protein